MKNIILLLLFWMSTLSYNNAQTTNIPDAAFERILVNQGIDSDGLVNGQILNTDAASITTLRLGIDTVRNLIGIHAFTNLDTLDCAQNYITNLNLLQNIALKYIDCHSNTLTTLQLPNTSILSYVNCWSNRLSTLNINNNTGLETLECGQNQVSSLNVSNNLLLSRLNCAGNNLSSLDVSNLTNLVELNCAGNNLSTLDVTNNTNLNILICSATRISSIDLSNNINLIKFACTSSRLTSLNLSNNTLLQEITCWSNQLSVLDLPNTTTLDSLSCSNNQIAILDVSNNLNLRSLDCSSNQISNLNLSNQSNLSFLHCDRNLLSTLDLSNNTNLQYLDCRLNQLSHLDLSTNTKLKGLNCSVNPLGQLDVSNNDSLIYLACQQNGLTELDLTNNTLLYELSASFNNLRRLIIGNPIYLMDARYNAPYLLICVGDLSWSQQQYWWVEASTRHTTDCYPVAVQGHIVTDANSNCLLDSTEYLGTQALLQFISSTDTVYIHPTDSVGDYQAYLDTGTYIVTLQTQIPYWQSCTPSQTVVVDTNYTVQTLDWVLEPIVNCPLMTVDLSAPFLRMTGGGSAYTISYCNQGTEPAYNAYVEVDLDADLNFAGASLPAVNTTGTTIYRFNLDTVAVGECGSFQVQVIVDTSSVFEQTHCTQAHIYPDSICLPIATRPIVKGDATCQNDTIFFTIENRGSNMLQPQNYTVIQDDIAMRVGTVQLGGGQSTVIAQAALPGKTYRIEVEQAPNFPLLLGDPIFSMAIEGCQPLPNGDFNTGFITQFSNGLSQPSEAIDCQQNIASYDPNDKAAQPVGYGAQHYIDAYTAIDYKIRFQNTGTDTAFNITIIDTLSPHVDIATLQMGASSHSYTWSILSNNVLRVDFANIMLPDSNVNEPLSNGFFRYRIAQQQNNPIGTLIENQAAIYFDYNPPIFTNTTFHTVGEDFVPELLVSVDKIVDEELNIVVFPNPFQQQTTLKIEGEEFELLEIEVYDLVGRKMQYLQAFDTNQITLQRGNLNQGIYIYRLIGDGVLISTGKLQAQH